MQNHDRSEVSEMRSHRSKLMLCSLSQSQLDCAALKENLSAEILLQHLIYVSCMYLCTALLCLLSVQLSEELQLLAASVGVELILA